MKKIVLMLMIAILGIMVSGCKLSVEAEVEESAYTFENKSSYTIKVQPVNQDWHAVSVAPGDTKTISVLGTPSFEFYTVDGAHSKDVYYESAGNGFIFKDYKILTFQNNSSNTIKVSTAAGDKTVYSGATVEIRGKSTNYTYTNMGTGEINVNVSGNTIVFTNKTNSFVFENTTSYTVYINPQNQSWTSVSVLAGKSVTINIAESAPQFTVAAAEAGMSGNIYYTVSGSQYTFKSYYVTTFINKSSNSVKITTSNGDQSVPAGATVEVKTKNPGYSYVNMGVTDIDVSVSGTTVTFTNKPVEVNQLRVTNKVNLNFDQSASGKSFSIHLITWGMPDENGNGIWFTPDTEYCKYYPANGNMVPTMKVGSTLTKTVDADENGAYLYYVITGTTGFAYYRTTELIKIGPTAGRLKSYTFYCDDEVQETDANGNDKAIVPNIRVVETINNGKRSMEREIPVIRIK